MKRAHRWTAPGARGDDSGIAMVMVLGLILTASVIVAAGLSFATNNLPLAARGTESVKALAAAQAGIDHYLAHLNRDRNYFVTPDCDNPALAGPNPDPAWITNPCGYGTGTPVGWVKVQPGDPASAEFHYDVNSQQMDQFTILLASTGRSSGVMRTLQAKITIAGSQRYLYVTDFEDGDPDNTVIYPNGAPHDHCGKSGTTLAKYWWSATPNERRRNAPNAYCTEIQFVSGDVLDGPVHFNDMPLVNGSTQFKQGFTTYSPDCPKTATTSAADARGKCYRTTNSSSPSLSTKGARWANANLLPDTTGDLVNKPGCQYTGDTRIRFNSNGTMDVWNTGSVGTSIGFVGNPPVLTTAPSCGNPANFKPATGQKYPAAKQTVPVPDGLVIFVRNSGSSATCVPGQVVNGTTSGSVAADVIPTRASDGSVSDISYFLPTYRRTRGSSTTWPTTPTVTNDAHSKKFDCGLGNVYIEGTVKGRVTIAAENNVVVTGDLGLAGIPLGAATTNDPSNIVGLVAQNSVVVYHPAEITSWTTTKSGTQTCPTTPTGSIAAGSGSSGSWCQWAPNGYSNINSYLSPPTTWAGDGQKHRWIYASIQTLAHSFWVASYNRGAPVGTLSVRGSIAQRWRGIVGTGSPTISTGYYKDYSYDKRLQTTSPPYFPPWANGEWSAETTGELPTPTTISSGG